MSRTEHFTFPSKRTQDMYIWKYQYLRDQACWEVYLNYALTIKWYNVNDKTIQSLFIEPHKQQTAVVFDFWVTVWNYRWANRKWSKYLKHISDIEKLNPPVTWSVINKIQWQLLGGHSFACYDWLKFGRDLFDWLHPIRILPWCPTTNTPQALFPHSIRAWGHVSEKVYRNAGGQCW